MSSFIKALYIVPLFFSGFSFGGNQEENVQDEYIENRSRESAEESERSLKINDPAVEQARSEAWDQEYGQEFEKEKLDEESFSRVKGYVKNSTMPQVIDQYVQGVMSFLLPLANDQYALEMKLSKLQGIVAYVKGWSPVVKRLVPPTFVKFILGIPSKTENIEEIDAYLQACPIELKELPRSDKDLLFVTKTMESCCLVLVGLECVDFLQEVVPALTSPEEREELASNLLQRIEMLNLLQNNCEERVWTSIMTNLENLMNKVKNETDSQEFSKECEDVKAIFKNLLSSF